MAIRIALLALAIPAAIFVALLAVPGLDRPWGSFSFHFYVVSIASLLAAFTCGLLIFSARSVRDTRILFLALSFLSLGLIFSVHGLATPGHLYHTATAAGLRTPWISTLSAGAFATLSVVSLPAFVTRRRPYAAQIIFGGFAILIGAHFVTSLAFPNWLTDFPSTAEWFQNLLTVTTVTLLGFAAWRYWQSYLFTRLPAQLAVTTGLLFLVEAQISLDFGAYWHYSWWLYHGLLLAAFLAVLSGWAWELLRARDARAIGEAIAMRDALSQLKRGRPTAILALANEIENHDLETHRHVDRVAIYAHAVGVALGFGPARLRDLVLAAQMHDVGKIGLPPYILKKAGKLTDDEWAQIKLHPAKGWEIATRARGLESIAKVIRHHHERYDGGGYPDGLAGENIPLDARIISVADTFDALTSERPYRAAMSRPEAIAELTRVAGSQLDPACVDVFVRILKTGTVSLNPPVQPDVTPVS